MFTKKETFSQRKIGKQLISVAMIGLLLSPVALSSVNAVSADEKASTATQAANIDKQLEEAIAKAKALGVEIKSGPKKTFQSKAELDAFNQEQLNKVNQEIAKAEAAKANSDKDKAAYEKAKAKYDEDKKKYDAEKAKYDAEIAKMEADKGKDGNLSQAVAQSLIYKSEPGSKATASNLKNAQPITRVGLQQAFEKANSKTYHIDGMVLNKEAFNFAMNSVGSTEESMPTNGKRGLGDGVDTITAYRLERNASVTVDYTNLKNSSYNGEPLSKVSMTISVDPSSENLSEYGIFAFTQDPSRGFNVVFRKNDDKSKRYILKFNVTMKFYDSKGNLINLTDENSALLGMSSFNSHGDPFGDVEGFVPGQGTSVIDITGSSIRNQDGRYYSNKVENTLNQFGQRNIDKKDNPYFWYLGSVLKMTGTSPTFQVFAADASHFGRPEPSYGHIPGLWMTVTSELATKVITKPAPPTPPQLKNTNNANGKISVEISPASLVITKHVEVGTGKELAPQEEGKKPKKNIEGYEFVETKDQDGNTIHFYKPVNKTPIKPKEDKKVYTRHYDIETGKELTKQEDGTKPKRQFDGYEFVETKTKGGDTEHFYRPIPKKPEVKKVVTKHIDITTGKELVHQEDGTQPKKDIPGYEFVETKDKDGNTEHFYRPIKKVVTKHIDKSTGKELAPQEDGTQPKRDFEGDDFVETKDENGNTIHYYTPKKSEAKKVITKHIDKDTGKEIAPQEDGTQPKKNIPGYKFVETKDEDGNTIHYYQKVITKHFDIDTKKEIAPQEEGQKPKKTIDGYEFVETKDENGDTHHFYRKVKKSVEAKTPTKYAETNEAASILPTILGSLGLLGSVASVAIKRRKK